MKLKTVTLVSFIVFVGIFVALAIFNPFGNPVPGSVASNGPSMTLEEVAKHSSPTDCYLIVKGAVYDVSTYIDQHPGGKRNITSRCGQEATKIFSAIHSNFAWNLLSKYYVGNIASNSVATTTNTTSVNTKQILENIKSVLQTKYANAQIVDVKPKQDFYVAKIIKDNKLYEIHTNINGEVLKEEVANDEVDWGNWYTDNDD